MCIRDSYYDGYKETDKLLPYIQTYNSVIMVKHGQKYRGWYDYKILFKEKIQDIVNNISLEKVSESVDQTNIYLNARALYKNHGIKDFPIKFSNGYNHYNKRVLCNRVGECEIKPRLIKVAHVDNVDIFVNAVVDLQTLEKHFNYSLQKKLFGKLELLNVSYQVRKEIIEPVVKQAVVKQAVVKPVVVKHEGNKYPLVVAAADDYTTPSAQEALANYEKYCDEDEPCSEYDSSSSYDPYYGNVQSYQNSGKSRSRGSFWLNFNFGGGRNIGYVNRGGW